MTNTKTTNIITQFETGKTYKMGWIGDSELFTTYAVLKRTAKTITVKSENESETKSCRINIYDGVEYIMPTGRYSMAPTLFANKSISGTMIKRPQL